MLRRVFRRLWALLIRLMLILALGIFAFNGVAVGAAYPWFAVVAVMAATWLKTRRR
jgi:hypothetical protein